jgi:hypothetical protein
VVSFLSSALGFSPSCLYVGLFMLSLVFSPAALPPGVVDALVLGIGIGTTSTTTTSTSTRNGGECYTVVLVLIVLVVGS